MAREVKVTGFPPEARGNDQKMRPRMSALQNIER